MTHIVRIIYRDTAHDDDIFQCESESDAVDLVKELIEAHANAVVAGQHLWFTDDYSDVIDMRTVQKIRRDEVS